MSASDAGHTLLCSRMSSTNRALTGGLCDQIKQLKHAQCEAQAIQCDVANEQQQQEVFDRHMQQYGVLDIAILNAGIGEKGEACCIMQQQLKVQFACICLLREACLHCVFCILLC